MDAQKKIFIIGSFFIIFLLIAVFTWHSPRYPQIILNGKAFSVEVADTQVAQVRGLSGHKPLTPDEGMLFVFPKAGNYGFWMKDMTFPLDIIWFDSDFKVVHIEKVITPETYPKIFYPDTDSQYVLEVNAGISDLINLKLGEVGKFSKN